MGFFLTVVYLVLFFLRPAELLPGLAPYHVMEIAAALAAMGTALSLFGGGPSFRAPQLYLTAAFLAWAAFSVLAAERWLGGALSAFVALGTNLFLFFLITLNVDGLRRLGWTRRVLVVLALGLVIQGAAAYFLHFQEARFVLRQAADEDVDDTEDSPEDVSPGGADEPVSTLPDAGGTAPVVRRIRALGFLHDPNDLAQALAAALPFVFLEWRSRRPLRNVCLVIAPAAVITGGILLTRSRGGLVALGAMVLASGLYVGSRFLSTFVVAAIGLTLVPTLAVMRVYARADESSLGRVQAWSEGLQMIKSSPVWGVGYGGYTDYSPLVAHNSFLHCFAELGFVGYFLWLGIIVATFDDLIALYRGAAGTQGRATEADRELGRWPAAAALALIGFLAGALFLSRAYTTTLFVFLALPTALADVARRSGREVAPFSPMYWALRVLALEAATLVIMYAMVRFVR
jgi:O-antigen ligase